MNEFSIPSEEYDKLTPTERRKVLGDAGVPFGDDYLVTLCVTKRDGERFWTFSWYEKDEPCLYQ